MLTIIPIWLVAIVSDSLGWGPAFALLGIGPALGIGDATATCDAGICSPCFRPSLSEVDPEIRFSHSFDDEE